MLRDWDPIRQKHVFGTVDIYTRGTTLSQQNESVTFTYGTTGTYGNTATYLPLTLSDPRLIRFNIPSFNVLSSPLYTGVELIVARASNSFYLGLERAQFDNVGGNLIVNPADLAYQYVGNTISLAKVPLIINGIPATNLVAVASLAAVASTTYSYNLFARTQSPLLHQPILQPVIAVNSVTGEVGETGPVDPSLVELIHTSDFLLNGGSNNAGDVVNISTTASTSVQKLVTAQTAQPVEIDTAMDVPLNSNGAPLDVTSVRSIDLSTLYIAGVDYTIVALENYRTYGLSVLTSTVPLTAVQITAGVLTVTVANRFEPDASVTLSGIADPVAGPIINGATVSIATVSPTQFTATLGTNLPFTLTTGFVTGSAIKNNDQVVVTYNKFVVYERPVLITGEQHILTGTLPSPLVDAFSFVHNVWLPESYNPGAYTFPPDPNFPATFLPHALTLDGWNGLFNTTDGGLDITGSATLDAIVVGGVIVGYNGLVGAQVPYASRYIKVTFNDGAGNVVMRENIDYTLTQDTTTGAWQLARILGGHIPDGGTVTVSYFATETFTLSTQFPAFVEILANQVAITKHAAADVLIKAMVASPVDITMTVTLQANASPESVDTQVRTAISIVLDNAQGVLYQSALIGQIQAITGVVNVQIPLLKCAKSDGSYDIGVVIPTGTTWTPLAQDPAFVGVNVPVGSFITASPVLPNSTIPSGGQNEAIVDLLYQGQVFRRAMSVQDFLTNSPSTPTIASTATPGSFYIIGTNDPYFPTLADSYKQKVILQVPQDVTSPNTRSFFVTYQVFGEGGAKDITVSSTEYLTGGTITINYITLGQ